MEDHLEGVPEEDHLQPVLLHHLLILPPALLLKFVNSLPTYYTYLSAEPG